MNYFDKANQIQKINAQLEKSKTDLKEIETLLVKKNAEYDKLNKGFEDYKENNEKKKKKIEEELLSLNKQLEEKKYAVKQQQQIIKSNEKREKEQKEDFIKEEKRIEAEIKEKKGQLSDISLKLEDCLKNVVIQTERLNTIDREQKALKMQNNALLEQIGDSQRFIKNLEIREQVVSARERRLNK